MEEDIPCKFKTNLLAIIMSHKTEFKQKIHEKRQIYYYNIILHIILKSKIIHIANKKARLYILPTYLQLKI